MRQFRRRANFAASPLRYTNYVGDGDIKTFKVILDAKPYGDVGVIKSECAGHVEKQMGSRLRNVKKSR